MSLRRDGVAVALIFLMLSPISSPGDQADNNALFSAVNGGDVRAVEKALKDGANPNARLMNGDTPIKVAERKGLTGIVQILRNAGGAPAVPAAVPVPSAAPAPAPEPVKAPPVVEPPAVEEPTAKPEVKTAEAVKETKPAAPAPVPQPPAATVAKPVEKTPVPTGPAPAANPSIQQILDSGTLAREYNGVVVDFLVEEGKNRIAPDQRKQALDQLVTSLKEKAQVSKDEQVSMSLGVLIGIGMGSARDDIVSDAGSEVESSYASDWDSWIDAAFQLVHAGYAQEAADFFEFGMKHIPYPELKARCVKGLAVSRPDSAYEFLMASTKNPNIEEVNVALRLLGHLASDPNLPREQHDAAIDKLIEFSQGMMHANSYRAAIYGLDVAGDPRAVEALGRFKKGLGIGSDDKRAALRSLLLTYKDTSVIDILKGMTKGGLMTLNNAWDNFYAGSLLIEAGDEAGFGWAQKQLAQVRKSFLASDKDPDLRPDIVRVLVKYGGERGRTVLAGVVDLYRDDQWLKTWIAIGLLELGDKTKAELVKKSLATPEWDYTAVRSVEALAKNGDYSVLPVLQDLILKRPPVRGAGAQLLGALAGRPDNTKDENRRLADLRIQIANALARINRPEGVSLAQLLLRDENIYVRSSAALALTEMTIQDALGGLVEAIGMDYGSVDGRSRNPEVQAHVLRMAAMRFPADPRTKQIVDAAASSPHPSLRFMALIQRNK